jgi:hypothetical protein
MDWGRRFRQIQDQHRKQDGTRWTGADIERATRGEVSRRYISLLKAGRIKDPSYSKIYAISKAMDFPLHAWVEH